MGPQQAGNVSLGAYGCRRRCRFGRRMEFATSILIRHPALRGKSRATICMCLPAPSSTSIVAVKDNLAIKQVDLKYELQGTAGSEQDPAASESQILLYRGPEKPVPVSGTSTNEGESRTIEYEWDLAQLQLPVGAQTHNACRSSRLSTRHRPYGGSATHFDHRCGKARRTVG